MQTLFVIFVLVSLVAALAEMYLRARKKRKVAAVWEHHELAQKREQEEHTRRRQEQLKYIVADDVSYTLLAVILDAELSAERNFKPAILAKDLPQKVKDAQEPQTEPPKPPGRGGLWPPRHNHLPDQSSYRGRVLYL